MCDDFPAGLAILIERVVRPLPLPLERQRRLREDYEDHLGGMYEEELLADKNPAAALQRVQRRFGDPAELTAELAQSVRWWERWQANLEKALAPRLEESTSRYTLRMTTWFVVITFSMCAFNSVDHHVFGTDQFSWAKLQLVVMTLLLVASWVGFLLFFGIRAGRAWEQHPRRWKVIIPLSLAHFATWPLSLMALMLVAQGSLADYTMPVVASLVGGAASVVCGIALGAMHCRNVEYRNLWARMEISTR